MALPQGADVASGRHAQSAHSFKTPGDLFNLIRSDFVAAGYDDIIFSAQHIDQSVLAHISKIFGADIVITHDFLIELRFMIITLHIHGSAAGEKARRLFGRIDCIALLIKKTNSAWQDGFPMQFFLSGIALKSRIQEHPDSVVP